MCSHRKKSAPLVPEGTVKLHISSIANSQRMQTEINKSGIYYSQNKDLSRKVILLNSNGIENNF